MQRGNEYYGVCSDIAHATMSFNFSAPAKIMIIYLLETVQTPSSERAHLFSRQRTFSLPHEAAAAAVAVAVPANAGWIIELAEWHWQEKSCLGGKKSMHV